MQNRSLRSLPDILLGLAAIALATFVYLNTLSFPSLPDGTPGPSLFPQILAGLMAVFGTIQLVQGFQARGTTAARYEPANLLRAALVLASIGLYTLVVPRLGFLFTSSLFLMGLMILLRVRLAVAVVAAAGVAWASALLFGWVLRVPLPPGPLGW